MQRREDKALNFCAIRGGDDEDRGAYENPGGEEEDSEVYGDRVERDEAYEDPDGGEDDYEDPTKEEEVRVEGDGQQERLTSLREEPGQEPVAGWPETPMGFSEEPLGWYVSADEG